MKEKGRMEKWRLPVKDRLPCLGAMHNLLVNAKE
jgi:hypothetical protein